MLLEEGAPSGTTKSWDLNDVWLNARSKHTAMNAWDGGEYIGLPPREEGENKTQ